MIAGSTGSYVNVVSDFCLFDLPFAYDSYWQMRKVCADEELEDVYKRQPELLFLLDMPADASIFKRIVLIEEPSPFKRVNGAKMCIRDRLKRRRNK